MDLTILTIILLYAVFHYLKKYGFQHEDALSLVIGIGWAYLFFTYGTKMLIFQTDAADFFILYSLIFWGGMALMASLPALKKKNYAKAIKIAKFFLGAALIYIAVDNFGLGPAAVGPHSPYIGKDICALDATFYAEDIFFGCYIIKPLGIEMYGDIASFVTYVVISILLLFLGIRLIGIKKVEHIIFGG